MNLVSRGVPLPQFDELTQIDLIEIEKRNLLMRFMDVVVQVYAPSGPTKEARELISRLREVYFVGYAEAQTRRAEQAARELEELSRKVFTIRAPRVRGGRPIMEVG